MPSKLSRPAPALVLAFLSVVMVGTGLLMLPAATADASGAPFLTALFTATSAVCVTGLVVVDTGTYWSPIGQWLVLTLFQLGGFGIMTFATLLGLLVNRQLRLRSRLMLQAETHSLGLGDVTSVAKLVLAVTVVMELGTTLLLTIRFAWGHDMPWGESLWHAFFHAVSAFNNAGFSTWGDSLMRFVGDPWVLVPVMGAIVVGGIGFPVLHETILQRGRRPIFTIHTALTLWGSAALIVGGAAVLLFAEWSNVKTFGSLSWPDRLLAALFSSVTARTAGFNVIDTGALTLESLNMNFLLMFIGGGSAGTAGGVKVTTFFVLLLVVWNEIRGHDDVEFRGRRLSSHVQRQALTILVLSAAVVVLATLVLIPMTSLPYEKVLFEVISAFATVGLSTGITAELPPAGQYLLVLLMFTGRVGVVTLAAAIAMNYVRRDYRFPEERPIVG